MTHTEIVKSARMLKALAKPLLTGGSRILKSVGELGADAGRLAGHTGPSGFRGTMRSGAAALSRAAREGDVYYRNLGRGGGFMNRMGGHAGRAALSTGRFAAGALPFMAIAAAPTYLTPVWSGMSAAGENIGQAARWMSDPGRVRRNATQGAQDYVLNASEMMRNSNGMQRAQIFDRISQPSAPMFQPRTYAESVLADRIGGFQKQSRALFSAAKAIMRSHPTTFGGLAKKWGMRAGAATAAAAPLPLGIGFAQGWFGGDDIARQAGASAAQQRMQERLAAQGMFGRWATQWDPSLMVSEANKQLPGMAARYQQLTGEPYQYGMLAGVQNAWNNPSFIASDASGSRQLNPIRPS